VAPAARLVRPDGAVISYQRTGSGPAVLFIQGVGIVGEGWRPQIDGLADRFTLVSFDNRGMGGSTLGAATRVPAYSVELLADDALAIMTAERIDRFHVVGHSLGGVIAQEVALRARDRVRSLALLCTFRQGRDGAGLTPDLFVMGLRTRIGTRRMRRNAFLELVLPRDALAGADRPAMAARLAPLFGHDLADQPPIVMTQVRAMARYDANERLATLGNVPTLVVSAAADRIARPASGRALAAAIPGARFVELDRAAHGVPIQQPERINALLADHFNGADTGA
jgi:pimeloyl-ACP methyl ester carboxylesterase